MSAAPSRRRPAAKGNIKVGICENHQYLNPDTGETGDCPKCASGEHLKVNVQRLSDFRCPVCGGKLTPVKQGPPLKWIGIGVAAAAVVALVVVLAIPKGDHKADEGAEPPAVTQTVDSDSLRAAQQTDDSLQSPPTTPVEEPATDGAKVKEGAGSGNGAGNVTPPPAPKSQSVLGGAATLVKENGYTTIRFNRSYTLDLGKTDGSTLNVGPGDEIYMANVRNGILYGGQYKSQAGQEKALSGLKVRL